MKKRVCSILLAVVLCVTMLSVVALATECADDAHTYDENLWAPNANGMNHSPKCDNCGHVREYPAIQHYDIDRDGICDACQVGLGAYLGNSPAQGGCFTTLQGALDYAGNERDSITVNPIGNQESVTYSGKNTQVTLNLAGVTINELKVTKGRLTIVGNGTVTKLEVTTGAKVELSGGTYGEITGVTDKNTLLGPGYVFDGDTVKEAPIKSVTASVTDHNNAKYGYTAEQAPVLTAAITPDNVTGVTYQWYKVNGSKKTTIDNATAQTYTVETGLNAGNYDYCCTATVGTYSLTSEEVKVTIAKADGPQLGPINVNQVYNDTASKTINIYDYIGTELNQLAKDAGKLRFHSGSYSSSPENMIEGGWDVDVNTGAITYQLANGLSVNDEIIITMTVGYNDQIYSKNHEDATVIVNITLTKITPTGTPNYTPITSSGKTLADANLNANNNAFSVPGEVRWVGESDGVLADDTPVEKGVAYHWEFRPTEGDKYERLTGSIILWTESGSGVVIIVPSQSGESTPASNPNTGAAHVGQPLPGLALLALAALCLYAGTRRF